MIQVQLLGPCRFFSDDVEIDLGTPKQVALAAALAVRAPAVVSRDRLIDDLWGESPPSSAGSTFAGYLSNLRRALEPNRDRGAEPSIVVTRRPGYLLDVPEEAVDLLVFRSLVQRAEAAAVDDAVQLLDNAFRLVRGPALEDVRHELSMQGFAAQIDGEVLAARELRFERLVQTGSARPEQIEAVIAEHPLNERLRALHAQALYHQGRQADALTALNAAREMMAEELGLDPSPELQQLEHDILNQSASLNAPVRTSVPSEPIAPAAAPIRAPARASDPTYGRDRELAVIQAAFDDLDDEKGTLLLISGETGTGKSHLALQILDEAARRGVVAGSGIYTDAVGRPPLSAWNDARRGIASRLGDRLFEIMPPELVAAGLEFVGGDINGSFSDEQMGDPEELQRFLDIMRSSGWHMAQHERLVILLEDFHWADEVSLAAIESWGRGVEEAGILLVVTYRHDEFVKLPACAGWLRKIASAPRTIRMALNGLDVDGVAALVRSFGGESITAPEIAELTARTGGNPLFVNQLCRLAIETGTPLRSTALPEEMLVVVRERLSQLSPEILDVLTTASLAESSINPEIDADILDLDPDDVDDRMLVAVDAGLLVHDPSNPGNYRFANALLREALSTSIGPRRRGRLHAQLGQALLDRFPPDPEVTIAAARHFCLGARAGTARRGAELALTAGRQSIDAFGYSTAYSIMGLGLDALEQDADGDDALRLELLKWRGLAAQALALVDEARDDLLRAFRLAISLDDPVGAAEVALAVREGAGLTRARDWWNPGETARSMLTDAIELVRQQPEVQAAHPRLLSDLLSASAADGSAGSRLHDAELAALAEQANEAVELATGAAAAERPAALLRRVLSRWLTVAPQDQMDEINTAMEAAVECGEAEVEMMTRTLACVAEIEAGNLDAARDQVARGEVRAQRIGCPPSRNLLSNMPGVLRSVTQRLGETDEVDLSGSLGRSLGPLADGVGRLTSLSGRFLNGDFDGALDPLLWPDSALSARPSVASTKAFVEAEAGRLDDARRSLEWFPHQDFVRAEAGIWSGQGWATALAARSLLGDLAEAREIHDVLSLLSGRQILPGPGVFWLLPADYYLGVGALALEEHGLADGYFETATTWAEQVGSERTLDRINRIT
jgi:DNA-binding SARP family transcriptional activator